MILAPALDVPASAQTTNGQWSTVQTVPYRPIFTQLLPTGKLLFYSYYDEAKTPQIWDPDTGSVTPAAAIDYSIFCSGNTFLADGRLFVAGGHEADYVGYASASIYNPYTDTWTRAPDMNAGRWYPTSTTLADGDVLVLSGDVDSNSSVDALPQVYQAGSNSWRDLTSAQLNLALYPRAFLAPNGKVFTAGPETTTRYLDVSGTGTWSTVANTIFGQVRDYGSAVMYEPGKILIVGGGDPPTNTAEVIDLNSPAPAWKATGSMHFARRQLNATLLPDGKVLITGGSGGSGFDNANAPVYPAEIWDPQTGAFTVLAGNTVYRGYHSTAILLPDGRVFAGGGNAGGPNYEIFSPPYLAASARPQISSAPAGVNYGQNFTVATPDAANIARVSLIRLGAVTHSFDMSQRFLSLNFTASGQGLDIQAPAGPTLAPPGFYMLFLLSANGVPSRAAILQITNTSDATGAISGTVTDTAGQPLAGATVTYNNGIALTDLGGNYTLSNVTAGAVAITASLPGYQSQTETVTVISGQTTSAPAFQLQRVQTGAITGLVTNAGGSPLSGVVVAYSGGSTSTGADGTYTLTAVPAGLVTITASASGYQSASQVVNVAANTSTVAPAFALTAAAAGSITGKVVNPSGAAIAGATVAYGGGSATTNANGNYVLIDVPVGTVQVGASAAGFAGATQNVTVQAGGTSTTNFTLAPAEGGAGAISGIVTDINNGQLLRGATVKLGTSSTLTNSSGSYVFANVNAGSYNVTASTNGYLARSAAVTVTSGNTTALNFQLSTAGQIAGTVSNGSGQIIAGASVQIQGGKIPVAITVTANSSGNYISGWVPIGAYTLSASASGYAARAATTTVATGVTSHVNFALSKSNAATGTISGRVTDAAGAAIAAASISYSGGTTATAADGSFAFPAVNAGTYDVTAQATGYTSAMQPVTVLSGQTATANFALAAISTGGSGTLNGVVVDISNNRAIAGASVSFSGGSTTTASNGSYGFATVSAGAYSLKAVANGYFAATQPVTVISGGTTTANFSLATGGKLAGTVKNASGAAVAGATVMLTGGKIATMVKLLTNSSGAYASNWLPVGTYTVTVSATGHTTQSKSTTVTTGTTTTLNFTNF